MQKFLVNTSGFAKDTASGVMALALIAFMAMQPLVGWLSDKVGRKTCLAVGFLGGAAAVYPVMSTLATTTSLELALSLVVLQLVFFTGYTAVSWVVKAEIFPAHVRALGVALPFAMANALFGGTAEYFALRFKDAGFEPGFYIYVAAMSAIACMVAIRLRNTNKVTLIKED